MVGSKLIAAAEGPRWPAVMPITSTLPPVEPFIPELLPAESVGRDHRASQCNEIAGHESGACPDL
jgi:hypothetical protein